MRGAVGVIVLVGYAVGVLVAVVIVRAGNVQAENVSRAVDGKLLEGAGDLELLIDHLHTDRGVETVRRKMQSQSSKISKQGKCPLGNK